MDFSKLAFARYSVRKYKPKAVPEELIMKVLEAGRMAPSAVNYQPLHFVVVESDDQKRTIRETYPREWFKQAPVYIVVCTNREKAWVRSSDRKNFADIDAAIATDHIVLQATELGLGTCWVCNFDVEKCVKILNLPEYMEPLVIIPIGYSDETPKTKTRRPLNEMLSRNSF